MKFEFFVEFFVLINRDLKKNFENKFYVFNYI